MTLILVLRRGRPRQVDPVSLRPVWSTYQVPEQPKLQRETLSPKTNNNSNCDDGDEGDALLT